MRIDPDPSRRKYHIGASTAFFLAMLALIGQLFWVCETTKGWKAMAKPQCRLGDSVAISQLTSA